MAWLFPGGMDFPLRAHSCPIAHVLELYPARLPGPAASNGLSVSDWLVHTSAVMFVLPGYDAFLGFLLISAAVPVLALVANKLLSPSSRQGERQLTYESGMEPIGGAWIQFNIRYYMFALVFVIFDVETVFLYPWAVAFHRLGLLAFIEALIFIAILVVALAYAWRKGALEWS
jgi:NAD(P)H-quinone oxidoreductase subunit 3